MLLIFDCNYIAWACAHAFSKGLTYEGSSTEVIFGFIRQILVLNQKFEPDQIVFCWDNSHSLRTEIYPKYKANRKELTDEQKESMIPVFAQFNQLKEEILFQLGFNNVFSVKGYESDDVIARLVEYEIAEETVIITADEDLYQLLDNCVLYSIQKKRTYTRRDLIAEYNLTPAEWVDAKALGGCKSDNVKGIESVGTKTVEKYLHNKLNKDSKTFKKIEKEKDEIYKINLPIVRLPFTNTPKPKLKQNNLTLDRYIAVCEKYGLNSLLQDEYERIWIKMTKLIQWR